MSKKSTPSKLSPQQGDQVWLNLCILLMRKLKNKEIIITAKEFMEGNLGDTFIDVHYRGDDVVLTLKDTLQMIEIIAERNKKDAETKAKMRPQ